MDRDITKKYSNYDITIVWKPNVCVHSALCWKQLVTVFNPAEKPWIKMEGANTERIIEQVNKCPSGALSYFKNSEKKAIEQITVESIVEPTKNGPLLVYGNISVKDAEGNITKRNKVTAFCRCGQSQNKPYCDGSHTKAGFER